MKPSHLQAPRQLADAYFVTGAGGIERSHQAAERVVLALVFFFFGLILGGVL